MKRVFGQSLKVWAIVLGSLAAGFALFLAIGHPVYFMTDSTVMSFDSTVARAHRCYVAGPGVRVGRSGEHCPPRELVERAIQDVIEETGLDAQAFEKVVVIFADHRVQCSLKTDIGCAKGRIAIVLLWGARWDWLAVLKHELGHTAGLHENDVCWKEW